MNETKKKILKVMYKSLFEVGYDKTSIQKIADETGIKKASVYYYFKSKQEILLELVKYLYAEDEMNISKFEWSSVDQVKNFLILEGNKLIDNFEFDRELTLVYSEIDIQSNRIPELKKYLDQYTKNRIDYWQKILYAAMHAGFKIEEDNVENYAEYLYTVQVGISDALLYEYNFNCKAIWKVAVETLIGGGNDI